MKLRVLGIVLAAFIGISATVVKGDKLFEIAKNIEIFVEVYKKLNADYADEVDPSTLMKIGIDAMMNSLDPYTRYWSDSQIASGNINSERRYLSIGATIDKINKDFVITDVDASGPSGKEGVLSGDILLKVNGTSTDEMTLEKVKSLMKGVAGSKMNLLLQRPGLDEAFSVTVERGGKNTNSNVPYFGVVGDDIAYVNLSTFTEGATKNIKEAIKELQEKGEVNGVILDLRYNGGGLLREAISISNLFLPKGSVVVSNRSKVEDADKTYKTRGAAFDEEIPVVVLINGRSASASEIVSGVMQDHDRGVLIGQRSFGKGLVQNFHQLGYNAQMKLTTHKYYLPSNRCIQKYYYEDGEAKHIPEQDWVLFKTKNGRKVYDGGGVNPDIVMEPVKLSPYTKALIDDNVIFEYVNKYVSKHKKISDVKDFKFDDINGFRKFVGKKKFHFKTNLEKELLSVQEKENLSDDEKIKLEKMISSIKPKNKDMIAVHESEIVKEISSAIIERYYFKQGKVQFQLEGDKEVNKAIEVLHNPSKYKKILKK